MWALPLWGALEGRGGSGQIKPEKTPSGNTIAAVNRHTAVRVIRGMPIKIIRNPQT